MWLLYSIISGLFYSIGSIITRYLLKGKKDAWAYSFWFSAVGAIIILPFTVMHFKASKNPYFWLLGIAVCVTIVIHNYLVNKAVNYISPSLQGSITKFRLLWILILGVLLLGESFSLLKLAGTLLTVFAGFVILSKFKSKEVLIGGLMTFIATFIYGGVITSYSYFLKHFNTFTLTFFVFSAGAVLNLVFMPHSFKRVKEFIQTNPILIICATSFSSLGFVFLNQALSVGEQSRVVVITESALIVTLAAEYIILKEREKPLVKLIAIALAVAGAILVKIG